MKFGYDVLDCIKKSDTVRSAAELLEIEILAGNTQQDILNIEHQIEQLNFAIENLFSLADTYFQYPDDTFVKDLVQTSCEELGCQPSMEGLWQIIVEAINKLIAKMKEWANKVIDWFKNIFHKIYQKIDPRGCTESYFTSSNIITTYEKQHCYDWLESINKFRDWMAGLKFSEIGQMYQEHAQNPDMQIQIPEIGEPTEQEVKKFGWNLRDLKWFGQHFDTMCVGWDTVVSGITDSIQMLKPFASTLFNQHPQTREDLSETQKLYHADCWKFSVAQRAQRTFQIDIRKVNESLMRLIIQARKWGGTEDEKKYGPMPQVS